MFPTTATATTNQQPVQCRTPNASKHRHRFQIPGFSWKSVSHAGYTHVHTHTHTHGKALLLFKEPAPLSSRLIIITTNGTNLMSSTSPQSSGLDGPLEVTLFCIHFTVHTGQIYIIAHCDPTDPSSPPSSPLSMLYHVLRVLVPSTEPLLHRPVLCLYRALLRRLWQRRPHH